MNYFAIPGIPNPTPANIIHACAKRYSVTTADIIGRSRVAHIAKARNMAMLLMRDSGMKLSVIGQITGGRGHSNVAQVTTDFSRMLRMYDVSMKDYLSLRASFNWSSISHLKRNASQHSTHNTQHT